MLSSEKERKRGNIKMCSREESTDSYSPIDAKIVNSKTGRRVYFS